MFGDRPVDDRGEVAGLFVVRCFGFFGEFDDLDDQFSRRKHHPQERVADGALDHAHGPIHTEMRVFAGVGVDVLAEPEVVLEVVHGVPSVLGVRQFRPVCLEGERVSERVG